MTTPQPRADELRHECMKCLLCLYLAADKSVADDVNKKVKEYINYLETRNTQLGKLE
jgi:hypothetical protein